MWADERLVFLEEPHEYYLDKKRIPGFHDVAGRFRFTETTFPIASEYLYRGKAIHEGIRLINAGKMDWSTVHEEIVNHLKAYELFVRESGWQSYTSEAMAYHSVHKYACRPDDFGYFQDRLKPQIIEYKTSAVPKWTGIQTAAQEMAIELAVPCERWGLALKEDGTYALKPFSSPYDHYMWESAISMWNYQANEGYKVFQ